MRADNWQMLVKKDRQKAFLSFKRYGQIAIMYPHYVQVARDMIRNKDARLVWTADLVQGDMHCPACGWKIRQGDKTQESYVQHGLWRDKEAYAVFSVYGCSDCRAYVFVPQAIFLTWRKTQLQVGL